MHQRLAITTASPEGYAAVSGLERYVRGNVDHRR